MTLPDVELETRTETVENTYVEFNGEEFDVALVLDFLNGIRDTDRVATFRYEPKYDDLAEALIGEDVVKRDVQGSWYGHDDRPNELYEQIQEQYYQQTNE